MSRVLEDGGGRPQPASRHPTQLALMESRDPDFAVEICNVSKEFGSKSGAIHALERVSLQIQQGEFVSVIGPSGCGKSTLLRIVAGLAQPSSGQVYVQGELVRGAPPAAVYMFQQYSRSLLPWRTALDNVAFALEGRRGLSRKSARTAAAHFLEMVGLAHAAEQLPSQLSGGMQQRVVIARALAAQPRVLLLDEPFGAVDALTRLELHQLLLRLWSEQNFTAVLVTHDVDEAVFVSDRVAMMSAQPGKLREVTSIGLPRPRDAIETRELPRFIEVRHHLLAAMLERRP